MAKITEIVLFHSNDTGVVPTSSQLVEGEIALNTADKRLFTEDDSATVIELGINPSSLTTGVLSATSVTSTGLLTAGGLAYPTADGSPSTVLATNGSGTLDFISVSGAYDLATQAEAEAGTVTTGKIFSPLRVKQAIDALAETTGADIASATAVDLTAATGNTVVITGTTTSTSLTMNAGQQMILLPSGAWPLTYHATTMNINGGVSYTCAAGDRIYAVKDLAGVIRVSVFKQDGTAVVTGSVAVGSITGLATGVATFLATSSSANLASAVTDETGSGSLVFATSPTFVTPALGTPASGTATNLTGLPPAGVTGTAAILGANTFTALQTQAAGADIASATAVDLTAATGNVVVITGTVTSTSLTMTKGQQMVLIAAAAWPLTFHATTMNINGGVSYTCAAGDRLYVAKDDDDVIRVSVTKQDGTSVAAASDGHLVTFTDSGSGIASDKPVILETAGTVTQVGLSPVSETLGGPVDANDVTTKGFGVDICYDSGNDKLVAFWFRNSDVYPMAAVGTISGTTTTWGTPVVAESVACDQEPSIAYDPDNEKVVLFYVRSSDNNIRATVGTVSATSISFGSSAEYFGAAGDTFRAVYDTTNNYFIAAYRSTAGSCNVKAGSISTGSWVNASSGNHEFASGSNTRLIDITYDVNADAVALLYRDSSNHLYGRAGTVDPSDGTATFGTATQIGTWNPYGMGSITYDATAQKCVALFKNTSGYGAGAVITVVGGSTRSFTDATETAFNSADIGSGNLSLAGTYAGTNADITTVVFIETSDNYPRFCNGTVSGTSISFNSAARLWSDNGANSRNNICNIADGKVAIIAQSNTTIGSLTDNYAAVTILQNVASLTNLTATNFIGVANEAISASATGGIMIQGGISTKLTSLTIGSTYYVQPGGTFATSAGAPSVELGKAVSATTVLMKGI